MPRLLSIACTLAVLSPSLAAAQNTEFENQVRFQLNLVKRFAETVGFAATHDFHVGSLRDDQSDQLTVTLEGGMEYRIVSFCDEDCSDVDLYLLDGKGNAVQEHTGTDDTPILEVRPDRGGSFTIRVRMYECSTEPCYFGVGVFGRRR